MENIINKLIELQTKQDTTNITIYLPFDEVLIDKNSIKTKINSTLSNPKFKKKLFTKTNVLKTLNKEILVYIYSAEKLDKGIAIFCNIRKEKISNMFITQLNQKPIESIYIGKTFDLDQLLWITNLQKKALVITLNQDEAKLLRYEGGNLNEVRTITNDAQTTDHEKIYSQYQPQRGHMLQSIAGSHDLEPKDQEDLKKFTNDIILEVQNQSKDRFDFAVIFYSSLFNNLIKYIQEPIHKLTLYPIISIQKNIRDHNKLLENIEKTISETQENIKIDVWQRAKVDMSKLSIGWYETARASRLKKIENLFITPEASKSGFILNQNYIYTYAVKNSHRVKNIAPWIVQNVFRNGGKIFLYDKFPIQDEEIAAQLRY